MRRRNAFLGFFTRGRGRSWIFPWPGGVNGNRRRGEGDGPAENLADEPGFVSQFGQRLDKQGGAGAAILQAAIGSRAGGLNPRGAGGLAMLILHDHLRHISVLAPARRVHHANPADQNSQEE